MNWYFENQKDNFVHKDKIREKLKILKKEMQQFKKDVEVWDEDNTNELELYKAIIRELEELLGE